MDWAGGRGCRKEVDETADEDCLGMGQQGNVAETNINPRLLTSDLLKSFLRTKLSK